MFVNVIRVQHILIAWSHYLVVHLTQFFNLTSLLSRKILPMVIWIYNLFVRTFQLRKDIQCNLIKICKQRIFAQFFEVVCNQLRKSLFCICANDSCNDKRSRCAVLHQEHLAKMGVTQYDADNLGLKILTLFLTSMYEFHCPAVHPVSEL